MRYQTAQEMASNPLPKMVKNMIVQTRSPSKMRCQAAQEMASNPFQKMVKHMVARRPPTKLRKRASKYHLPMPQQKVSKQSNRPSIHKPVNPRSIRNLQHWREKLLTSLPTPRPKTQTYKSGFYWKTLFRYYVQFFCACVAVCSEAMSLACATWGWKDTLRKTRMVCAKLVHKPLRFSNRLVAVSLLRTFFKNQFEWPAFTQQLVSSTAVGDKIAKLLEQSGGDWSCSWDECQEDVRKGGNDFDLGQVCHRDRLESTWMEYRDDLQQQILGESQWCPQDLSYSRWGRMAFTTGRRVQKQGGKTKSMRLLHLPRSRRGIGSGGMDWFEKILSTDIYI